MLSIIIPTLNEEKRLPGLLESLKREGIDNYEIIIADAGSKDKTKEIACSFGCLVVQGGLPAVGRNNGAKFAKGELLLFLDADVKLAENFLIKSMYEFAGKNLTVASFPIFPQKNNFLLNRATLNIFYNYPQRMFRRVFPMGAMGIMVRKAVFDQVGGFDPEIKLAEDVHFVQEASELGKFGVIKSAKIYMPLRRFEKDGYFPTFFKFLFCGVHMATVGPMKKDLVKYEFGYPKKESEKKD